MILKTMRKHKKVSVLILMVLLVVGSVAADVDTKSMDDTVNNIVDFFNGAWVKGICCVALIGECLGLIFAGGQNPQIFKKFLPLIAGTVLFMCAGKIVTIIFGTNKSNFSTDLTGMHNNNNIIFNT